MFIFKRKRWSDLLMKGCPAGAVGFPSPKGWIDCDLFISYLKHFVKFAHPSKSNPVLLILDGHVSHKSLQAVDFARENFITLLSLPPHTSHRLQPLDITFFGPLKKAINREADKWMARNPGKRLTPYDLCELFAPAYDRVACMQKAIKGFETAGIWPYNPDQFADDDFAPSTVTELPIEVSIEVCTTSVLANVRSATEHETLAVVEPEHDSALVVTETDEAPQCSHDAVDRVSVKDVSPYPRVSYTGGRKRRAEASEFITGSLFKYMLQQKEEQKLTKMTVSARKKLLIANLPTKTKIDTSKMSQPRGKGNGKGGGKKTKPVAETSQPRSRAMKKRKPFTELPELPRKPKWLKSKNTKNTCRKNNY